MHTGSAVLKKLNYFSRNAFVLFLEVIARLLLLLIACIQLNITPLRGSLKVFVQAPHPSRDCPLVNAFKHQLNRSAFLIMIIEKHFVKKTLDFTRCAFILFLEVIARLLL